MDAYITLSGIEALAFLAVYNAVAEDTENDDLSLRVERSLSHGTYQATSGANDILLVVGSVGGARTLARVISAYLDSKRTSLVVKTVGGELKFEGQSADLGSILNSLTTHLSTEVGYDPDND